MTLEADDVGIDLGGFFEDSDTTGSTFGFTPISPN
jgi:hypothetical protein